MVFNATILIYENTHSKMTQMKNANITAAPQLLSLAELNFDYLSCSLTRWLVGCFMVFNATFNNIPVFSGFVLLNR